MGNDTFDPLPPDLAIPQQGDIEDEDDAYGDEEDDLGNSSPEVIMDPELPQVYFNEGKFKAQVDSSVDLFGMASKNIRSVFGNGMATDPETALMLYKETASAAVKMIDVARKLSETQNKSAAMRKAWQGNQTSNQQQRDVSPRRETLPVPTVTAPTDAEEMPVAQEIQLPADAGQSLANSRFNP